MGGASEPDKRVLSRDIYSKKGRAEKQLFAWQKNGKRQPARAKAPRIKKKDGLL
jgi:hypothetical protein